MLIIITYFALLCVPRAAAAITVRSPQAAPVSTSGSGSFLNVTASNDTSAVANSTTPIKIAWNLGPSPLTAELGLLPVTGIDNSSIPGLLNDTIVGPLIYGNESTASNLDPSDIVFISCDSGAYDDTQVSVRQLWTSAVNKNVAAIVFVSTYSALCKPGDVISSRFPYVYTMRNQTDSRTLVNASITAAARNFSDALRGVIAPTSKLDANGSVNALSTGKAANTNPSDADAPPTYDDSTNGNNSGSPSTAVAMIILYSITGVITALFLLVVITGAIRAHRHPERYGPAGNGAQGGRQSRAKGLARAMLETLPIVKFTVPETPDKDEDMEMHTAEPGPDPSEHATAAAAARGDEVEKGTVTRSSSRASAHQGAARSIRSGIGPAAPARLDTAGAAVAAAAATAVTSPRPATAATDDNPGCSICTDDFEPGQDLRLLPCGHRFHPACVDPWLLNVSGSCPLCRIDLNQDLKAKRKPSAGTPVTATEESEDQPARSDSVGVVEPDGHTGGAIGRTRRLSRLALARFVGTAPLAGRRRARPRSGPMANGPSANGAYSQVDVASPLSAASAAPDAETPGAQETPTWPPSSNRHSR